MPGWELMDDKELKEVIKIFKDSNGVLFAHGFDSRRNNIFRVRDLEKNFSKELNSKYSLMTTSGTMAQFVAMKALGVKAGDEVITQAFTFVATIEAILALGAKPIIIDIDNSYNMDPNCLEKSISKKTKLIIPVHMLGNPCNMKKIVEISKKYKIPILEDVCESLGGRFGNDYLGTIGDCGVFSLDFGKFITTGEGGMLLTNNKKYHKYMMEYHDHGHENNPKLARGEDTKTIPGFNYRMTELQAVVGKVQLKKVNYILQQNYKRYKILEKYLSKYFKLRKVPKNSTPNYDTFIFYVNKNEKIKVLKLINQTNFGTKNLPDAIKWHFAFYWKHAISKNQLKNTYKSKKILENYIAVPILLKKSVSFYREISKNLAYFL